MKGVGQQEEPYLRRCSARVWWTEVPGTQLGYSCGALRAAVAAVVDRYSCIPSRRIGGVRPPPSPVLIQKAQTKTFTCCHVRIRKLK